MHNAHSTSINKHLILYIKEYSFVTQQSLEYACKIKQGNRWVANLSAIVLHHFNLVSVFYPRQ